MPNVSIFSVPQQMKLPLCIPCIHYCYVFLSQEVPMYVFIKVGFATLTLTKIDHFRYAISFSREDSYV